MADAHEHLRPPEDQGSQAGDRLLVVATLLHGLEVNAQRPICTNVHHSCGVDRTE